MLKLTKRLTILLCSACLVFFLAFGFIACKPEEQTSSPQENSSSQPLGELLTLSFDTLGGNELADIEIVKGEVVSLDLLPTPEKEGFHFTEWYLDDELTQPFSTSEGVFQENATLYAGYVEPTRIEMRWEDTEETALLEQPTNAALTVNTNGVPLTTASLEGYLTVTNHFEYIERPELTVEKSGEHYLVKADPAWPHGGMYTFELKAPLKFLVDLPNQGTTFTYAASKLYFTVEADESLNNVVEQDFIVTVTPNDYYAADENTVTLKQDFAFENNIKSGSILKIFDGDGNHEIVKADSVSVTTVGGVSAVNATLVAPELNEVYQNFDISSNTTLTIEDTQGTADTENIRRQLEENESFEILRNYSLLSALDYLASKNLNFVSSAQLLDGTVLPVKTTGARSSGARASIDGKLDVDIYSEYQDGVGPKYEDDVKFTCVTGSWRINFGSPDSYAVASVTVKDGGYIYLGAEGRAKTTSKFPWCDIGFSVCAGVESYEQFEFDIVIHHDGEVFDVRKDIEEKGHYAPDVMVQRYRTLLGIDDTKLGFQIDIFSFNATILQILNFEFPVGVEFSFTLNGSFAVTIENNYFHIFGFKGGTQTSFAVNHAELYQQQKVGTYYNGMFQVRAGIVMGVRFSVLNLTKIGSIGIDFGVGVYFSFYGYGHTYSEYSKILGYYQPVDYWDFFDLKDNSKLEAITKEDYKESGGSYQELGIYITIEIVAESSVFKASAELEVLDLEIPLLTMGDDYIVIGFADKFQELIDTGLTVDQYGADLREYDADKMKVMYLKTGKVDEIVMDAEDMEYRGVPSLGYITDDLKLVVRDDVIDRGKSVESMMQLTYSGGNIYNSTGNTMSGYPEIRYVPFAVDDSKADQTYTVNLTADGEIMHTFQVPYGGSVMYQMTKQGITYDSLAPDEAWMAAHPDYESVNWKYSDLTKTITENTSFERYSVLKYIQIGYSVGYISPQYNTFHHYNPTYVYTPVLANLYDVLADVPTPDVHENIVFKGWSVENKVLRVEDDKLVVEAVYEFKDITVTVEVKADTLSGKGYGKPGIYQYKIKPGTMPRDVVWQHCGFYSLGYQAYVAEASHPENDYLYEDASYVVDWQRSYYTITFYDVHGAPLYYGMAQTGSDATQLLDLEEIKNYSYQYTLGSTLLEFVGWAGLEKLTYVNEDINIHPIIEQAQRTTVFDPSGGEFKYSFSNVQDGKYVDTSFYGTIYSEGYLNQLTPVKEGTNDTTYAFNGWYYLDENNEKVFEVTTVTENRTYFADWTETQRVWTITINGGSADEKQGTFADGSTKQLLEYSYAEAEAFIQAIRAKDYSVIPELPTIEGYTIDRWYYATFVGTGYEITPFYTAPPSEEYYSYFFDLGKGVNGSTQDSIYEYRTPLNQMLLDATRIPAYDDLYPAACYREDGKYYTFKEWRVEANGETTTMQTDDYVVLNEGETKAYITAVYTEHLNEYSYLFKLEQFDPNDLQTYWEIFDLPDGTYTVWHQELTVHHGDVLTEDMLPQVTKAWGDDIFWYYGSGWYSDKLWKYELDYWLCEETGEKFVDLTVEGDRTYKAYFKKVPRTVNVTLDAGKNAAFPTTGTRYLTIENVTAGTQFSVIMAQVEKLGLPKHVDSDTYVFDSWDYSPSYDLTHNETIKASFWNKLVGCAEGEEELIRVTLDAGVNGIFRFNEARFMTVGIEPNEPVLYFIQGYEVVIDGISYEPIWEVSEELLATEDIAGTVFTYTALEEIVPGPELVTVTLDAGENAVFYSNGQRFRQSSYYDGQTIEVDHYTSVWKVLVDGVAYFGVWEGFTKGTLITTAMQGKTFTLTELLPIETITMTLDAGENGTFANGERYKQVSYLLGDSVHPNDVAGWLVYIDGVAYTANWEKLPEYTHIEESMQGMTTGYTSLVIDLTMDASNVGLYYTRPIGIESFEEGHVLTEEDMEMFNYAIRDVYDNVLGHLNPVWTATVNGERVTLAAGLTITRALHNVTFSCPAIEFTLDAGENGTFDNGERYKKVGFLKGDTIDEQDILAWAVELDGIIYRANWKALAVGAEITESLQGTTVSYTTLVVDITLDATGVGNINDFVPLLPLSFDEGYVLTQADIDGWKVYDENGELVEGEYTWTATLDGATVTLEAGTELTRAIHAYVFVCTPVTK